MLCSTGEISWMVLSAQVSSIQGTTTRKRPTSKVKITKQMDSKRVCQVRAREGDAFDLAAFHRRALDLGSLGLDVLHGAVLGEFD